MAWFWDVEILNAKMDIPTVFDHLDGGEISEDQAFDILSKYDYKIVQSRWTQLLEDHKKECHTFLSTSTCSMVDVSDHLLRRLSANSPIMIPILSKATEMARKTYGSTDINASHLLGSFIALITVIILILKFIFDYF